MKNICKLSLLISIVIINGCHSSTKKKTKSDLIIFHAGSLAVPFKLIADGFMKENPGIKVLLESAGSRECAKKITDLNKPCDIIASSDYTVIRDLLVPKYTNWYINFATNEMCIAYTKKSRMADKIDSLNWQDILLNKDVSFGRSDPDADPCGYRAIQMFQLAEKYYKTKGTAEKLLNKDQQNMRPKEVDLLALLESESLDYVIIYRSVAIQHKLEFVTLPDEINLKTPEFSEFYSTVQTEIAGKKKGEKQVMKGEPMLYAFSVLDNAPNKDAAMKFAAYLLSPEKGEKIMQQGGQTSINAIDASMYLKVPDSLKKYLTKK